MGIFFDKLVTMFNNFGMAAWLIPLLVIIIIVLISKGKDLLDLANIEKDDIYYRLVDYLIKDSLPDSKNIIKIEYELSDEIKSLRQTLEEKITFKNTDFKGIETQFYIPIKTLCYQNDSAWIKENRNKINELKIDSENLEKLYIQLKNEEKEHVLRQSKIRVFVAYSQKQKLSNIFLNAGLYNAFARKLLGTIQFKETVSDTLIGVMLNKKAKTYTRSYIYLLLPIILYVAASLLTSIRIEPLLIYANVFFLASTFVNQKVLEFRIAKGYYGSNEYESREMLRFIAENSDRVNFSGGTGLKPFPAEDVSESIWIEGCITV